MSEVQYNQAAQISISEWRTIQRLRTLKLDGLTEVMFLLLQKFVWLLSEDFGTLIAMKVHDGVVSDGEEEIEIRVKVNDDRALLKRIQSH